MLIEVLIALVILSSGIVLVLRAFQTSVTALGEARREPESESFLIREKISDVTLAAIETGSIPAGTSRGTFDPPDEDREWTVHAETMAGLTAVPDPVRRNQHAEPDYGHGAPGPLEPGDAAATYVRSSGG